MAAYATLKAAIDQFIKANGNKEITGPILNNILTTMINTLGEEYFFAGVATPSTSPGQPEQKVVYFASQAGTYTNFGAVMLPAGIHLLMWNGTSWSHQTFFVIDAVPTSGSNNFISSGAVFDALKQNEGVYDVTAKNNGATFASLQALLSDANLSTYIPTAVRKGGMSIKFVQSSDNYYVQYILTKDEWSTNINDWEKINLESELNLLEQEMCLQIDGLWVADKNIVWNNGYVNDSNGVILNSAFSQFSQPIPFKVGEKLSYKTGATYQKAVIKVSDSTPVQIGDTLSGDVIIDYDSKNTLVEYVAEEDMYIVISCLKASNEISFTKHNSAPVNKQIIYDVSLHNNGLDFASLQALLSDANLSTLIPTGVRTGGMSIRFLQTSDNKFVQYRYMSTSTANADFINTNNWQKQTSDRDVIKSTLSNPIINVSSVDGSIQLPSALSVNKHYYITFSLSAPRTFAITLRSALGAAGQIVQTIEESKTWQSGETMIGFECSAVNGNYLRLGESGDWMYLSNVTLNEILSDEVEQLKIEQAKQVKEVIYDVSANNGGISFASLYDLLHDNNISTLIPIDVRTGGMSIRFKRSSDGVYLQYRLMATDWTVDTDKWALYSDFVIIENPEFSKVLVDKDNKIVVAIKKDGDVVFGAGVPKQLTEYVSEYVGETCGKYIENPEFSKMLVDNIGRIVLGVKKDGDILLGAGVPSQVLKRIVPIEEFVYGTSRNISITKSAYINPDSDTENLLIEVPALINTNTLVEVNSKNDLLSAINSYNAGSDIYIKLNIDIDITDTVIISGSSAELVIDGNGHMIYQKSDVITREGISKGVAFATAEFSSPYTKYLTQNGKILTFSKTDYYSAASWVTSGGSTNIYKFMLPDILSDIVISESDNVYVNFTSGYYGLTGKVTKVEDGYLYFDYSGSVNVNMDYNYRGVAVLHNKFTSFCLINFSASSDGLYWRNNKLYFPLNAGTLIKCGNFTGFELNDNRGLVRFSNISFVGSSSNFMSIMKSKAIIDGCKFEGFQNYPVQVSSYDDWDDDSVTPEYRGEVYILNSSFSNMEKGAVYAQKETVCVVKDSRFIRCSIARSNDNAIISTGLYHIANNIIEDYGYGAIRVGMHNISNPHICKGIVEYNTIIYTPEYIKLAHHLTVFDSGAIYVATNNSDTVIRYNRIVNYMGRGGNRGIYCDDGAYNFKIYSNIVYNTPNSNSIEARFATGIQTAGNTDNVNKIIAQNIITGSLLISGKPDVADNGCRLGSNIFTSYPINARIINIPYTEEQLYNMNIKIVDGVCVSNISLAEWLIN